jgi:heptosyltransferase I
MRVALVKTSSMGDVIHTFPAVSDIRAAFPEALIDWVVEESFADLPALHPAVHQVHRVAMRRWRKAWGASAAERKALWQVMREPHYDHVIDLQGLLKSAYVAWHLTGLRSGFDWSSAREPLATLSYQRRFAVSRELHAIARTRHLAAQALGYAVPPGTAVFGLRSDPHAAPVALFSGDDRPYLVCLHATARPEKLWPAEHWQSFGRDAMKRGYSVVLPWGSPAEREAAQTLAGSLNAESQTKGAIVPGPLSLAQAAAMLAQAQAVIGVDTGLTHLAAALDKNTVCIFGATESWRYGPTWSGRARSLGGPGQWPGVAQVIGALNELGVPW